MPLPDLVSELTGKPIKAEGREEAYATYVPPSALKSPNGCSRTIVDFGQDELGGDCLCFSLAVGQHDLGFEDPFEAMCILEHVQSLHDQGLLIDTYGKEVAEDIERILLEIDGDFCAGNSEEEAPTIPLWSEEVEPINPSVTRKLNRIRTSGSFRGWKKPTPCEVSWKLLT